MAWTLEQQAAIELRHCELLVSAAAGSGKTAVLVERITQCVIQDEVPIDEMLIVTYTNAAAGEMRARIEGALSKLLDAHGTHPFLQEQLKRLNRAQIKTFHAFCLDVVRQNFQALEIDPTFRMANENELQVLIYQALDETLEAFYELESDAFVELVEGYSGNRDDAKLRELILSLYRFIQSQAYPLKWLEAQTQAYETTGEGLCEAWLDAMTAYHKVSIDAGIELLDEALAITEAYPELDGYRETFSLDRQGFLKLLELTGEAFEKAVLGFEFSRLKPLKKDDKAHIPEELVIELKDEIRNKLIKKQIFEKIKGFYTYKSTARYLREIQEQATLVAEVEKLVRTFDATFQAKKLKRNIVDFNDLEHYAVALLDDERIASRYREQFKYLFVDEYQDASAIQEQILNRIKRVNALFMVGDIKQSIYKFRLADPQIFVDKYKAFERFSDMAPTQALGFGALNDVLKASNQPRYIRVDLSRNFRTRPSILSAVNDVFEAVMQPPLGEIAYDDAARLNAGMAFSSDVAKPIELYLISKKDEGSEYSYSSDEAEGLSENESFFEDMKNDEIEARAAVIRIKALMGTPIYHPKQGETAPCRYKDIVLLIRSVRSWTPIFETIFMEEGIPLYADNPKGYFDTLEIKFMLSLLKLIANPFDDIALLTVLRAPIVGMEIEALIELKAASRGMKFLYEGLEALPEGHPLQEGVETFLKRLATWRKASEYMLLDDFLWYLLRETGLYDYCIVMPGGAARAANLTLLVDRASEYRQSQIVSLTQFIQFIEALNIASGDMGVANTIGENDDVVRLMSIHKSKGLEFPVVMLMGLSRKINVMDSYGDLLLHKDEGLALSYVDTEKRTRSRTLPQWVIRSKIQRETYAEELRVLYVALTRPVDRLICFGTFDHVEKRQMRWQRAACKQLYLQPSCFMDWIMPAWHRHEDVDVHILNEEAFTKHAIEQQGDWTQRLGQWQAPEHHSLKDFAASERVKAILGYTYPQSSSLEPTKTAVTQAQKAFSTPELMTLPSFMSEHVIRGVDKGTATHALLERLNLKWDYTEAMLKEKRDALIQKGILNAEIGQHIDLEKIIAFLRSELGIKLKSISVHHHEVPFILRREQQLIQGVVDFYAESESGIILIDFKTDYRKPEASSPLWLKYKDQIANYKTALETLTQKPVIEAYLVFLMTEEVVKL